VVSRRFRNGSTPTVLLVHDAFADTGTWAGTVRAGATLGTELVAVPNPLRGLASDGHHVAAAAGAIDGPVLLVGHGYGGAVASVAATRAGNVVGLVYVAALVPVPTILSLLSARFLAALAPTVDGELYLRRADYPSVYAQDLSTVDAMVAAALQRPVVAAAFEARWDPRARVPSHYLVATADRVLDARAQYRVAAAVRATTTEVDASHAVVLSRPDSVAEVIRSALST
jgi:pimeloyl-ACP methyl ester carboxylesterase